MPVTDSAFKPEKVKILTIVKPLLLALRAPAHRTVTFIAASCRQQVHDAAIPTLARRGLGRARCIEPSRRLAWLL